jgi:hypothetical protein
MLMRTGRPTESGAKPRPARRVIRHVRDRSRPHSARYPTANGPGVSSPHSTGRGAACARTGQGANRHRLAMEMRHRVRGGILVLGWGKQVWTHASYSEEGTRVSSVRELQEPYLEDPTSVRWADAELSR